MDLPDQIALLEHHIEVIEYDEAGLALAHALSNDFYSVKDLITEKKHYIYFKEFFGDYNKQETYGHKATVIVIEKTYTSKSYLDDYQEHYVLAYNNYDKTCKRAHFFNYDFKARGLSGFTSSEFLNEYKNYDPLNESDFWKSYLGYIVIRPLPKGLIGATILKGYTNDERRKYSACRDYKINLWGIEKKVNSMLYIEQDSIIGACATSALFTAFHKAAYMFQTQLPYPNKITASAGISFTEPNRILPNRDGLDIRQIASAIHNLGLVPEVRSPNFANTTGIKFDNLYIKAYMYAYCRMGIPIILGFELLNKKLLHAVTINGYRDLDKEEVKTEFDDYKSGNWLSKLRLQSSKRFGDSLILKSFFIHRFYAHDDQIGPFSRIGFEKDDTIISSWWSDGNIEDKVRAKLYALIVPLENIIRIHFELVLRKLTDINNWVSRKLNTEAIYWDVYLDYSNEYKKRLIESKTFDYSLNHDAMMQSLPKYIWVAELYVEHLKVFDILFDSAEINEKFFAVLVNFQNSSIKSTFIKLLKDITPDNVEDELGPLDLNHLNLFLKACNLATIKLKPG